MDLLTIIGMIVIIYFLIYIILPWFLDCDLCLAFYEKFGKPISSLEGKIVWITGASSGIGENLAYILAKAGCKLILSSRKETKLEKVKTNCLQKNKNLKSSDIEVLVLDILDINKHELAFNTIIAKFGRLDILVNNAGRSQRAKWENIELSVDKEMFDLNVFSTIALSRLVAKYFFQVNKGHFVINSSIAGVTVVPFSATYCASKYSLHAYFESLSMEKINKNISVTIVCPGPVETNFLAESFTEKSGEKYIVNEKEKPTHRMTAKRCATLIGIAIANKLSIVWICKSIVLQMVYLRIYYPNIGTWIIKQLGTKFLHYLRDNKRNIENNK
ncbi:dehydrogenase/reductase SDR family member 7 isoform X2 [Apis cerana]|uniref:Dehydrogenase/reductase SDR family member n=1 Tax=Apis cerana cerana TaxID=94128 RepID=A0A2A3EN26_APICC|nr:dehydrogenase/reductase SDR family member 7 isoform X2 [Apis cerana]PBC32606.1 Dehydrogenase/reductase SDR family member [Apis cerana cerana]